MSAIPSVYAARYAAQSYRATTAAGGAFAAAPTASTATTAASAVTAAGDSAEISLQAYAAIRTDYTKNVMELLFPAKANAGSGAYKTLAEVGEDFQNDFDRLTGVLGRVFGASGLSFDPPLSMKLDGMGGVATTAEGQAANAAKAGSVFAKNGTLVSQFAVMAARGAISEAATAVPGFADAYARDPAGTIREYIGDLENLLFGFTLTAGGDGFGTRFD